MKLEDLDFGFKFTEVERYATAQAKLDDCILELNEFDDLEAEIYPTMTYPDYDAEILSLRGMNVENFVLDRLEKREFIVSTIERLKKKNELFELAMSELTPRERDVVNVLYRRKNFKELQVSRFYFEQVKEELVNKLYIYFELLRIERKKQRTEKYEEKRLNRALELKKALEKQREERRIRKEQRKNAIRELHAKNA